MMWSNSTSLGKVWPRPDGGVKSVFGGITGIIRRQEKIAVVGVNGAGKSTFLRCWRVRPNRQPAA